MQPLDTPVQPPQHNITPVAIRRQPLTAQSSLVVEEKVTGVHKQSFLHRFVNPKVSRLLRNSPNIPAHSFPTRPLRSFPEIFHVLLGPEVLRRDLDPPTDPPAPPDCGSTHLGRTSRHEQTRTRLLPRLRDPGLPFNEVSLRKGGGAHHLCDPRPLWKLRRQ